MLTLSKKFLYLIIFLLFIQNTIQQTYTGDGTVYADNLNGGSCGFKKLWTNNPLPYNNMGVAMNAIQYNNSLGCGRCVSIHYQGRTVNAIVADLCPECKFNDLDMFKTTWDTLMQITPSRQKISWEFIECPDNFVNGNVQLRIDELNYYWVNIQPENFKCGISSLYIYFNNKWVEMTRNENGMIGLYFNYNGYLSGSFKFKIVNIYGEELISDKMDKLQNLIQMNGQFNCNEHSNFINTILPTSTPIPIPPKINEVTVDSLGNVISNKTFQPYNLDC